MDQVEPELDQQLELEIGEWRDFVEGSLEASMTVDVRDIEELEDHLRTQIADLTSLGLSADEAFLVAVKRLGAVDELTREFAREHRGRLWKNLMTSDDEMGQGSETGWLEALVFAAGAAITVQVARLVAGSPGQEAQWLFRNASLFVLPFLACYFIRRRRLTLRQALVTITPFLIAAVVINVYPYATDSSTELLVATHLPVGLWLVVAYPYMSGVVRSHEQRMDFVRFMGEWFIYYVLIALGGGVLTAMTTLILEPTGVIAAEELVEWVLPSGAAGAVIIAAWLVESKQRVVENMAPVLTMLFTPMFALMLAGAAVVYAFDGLGGAFDRELLGVFDGLMVVVLGLVLYGISARDPSQGPGWMDRIQLVAVGSALLLDLMVLGVMVARIGELGFTPNRSAALGLNLVLLVSLTGTAWLLARFVAARSTFHRLERWQTDFLPVFGVWAAVVVVVLPPLFGFR